MCFAASLYLKNHIIYFHTFNRYCKSEKWTIYNWWRRTNLTCNKRHCILLYWVILTAINERLYRSVCILFWGHVGVYLKFQYLFLYLKCDNVSRKHICCEHTQFWRIFQMKNIGVCISLHVSQLHINIFLITFSTVPCIYVISTGIYTDVDSVWSPYLLSWWFENWKQICIIDVMPIIICLGFWSWL